MKIHAQEIFKRNLQFILFLGLSVICVITVAFNLKTISKSSRPIIIGIDANGSRIVTESNDPIFKTEAIAFIQKFTFNIYNFDSDNFMKRIGLATSMMSEELWKKKRGEILDLKNKIEKDEIAVSGRILKLTIDEVGIYHGLIEVKEKSRLNIQDHKVEVSIKLKSVSRNQDNPSGLEVDSYEETLIRN